MMRKRNNYIQIEMLHYNVCTSVINNTANTLNFTISIFFYQNLVIQPKLDLSVVDT